MSESYPEARKRLFAALQAQRMPVVTFNRGHVLKYPYLIMGRDKFTFTTHAVKNTAGNSTGIDIRDMPVDEFLSRIGQWCDK